jgi:hypothetical protein
VSWQTEKGVYFMTTYIGEEIKIGYGDVPARKRSFATANAQDVILLAVATGETRDWEQELKDHFAASRCRGRSTKEWFHVTSELTTLIEQVQREYHNVGAPPVPRPLMRYRSRDDRSQGRRRQ